MGELGMKGSIPSTVVIFASLIWPGASQAQRSDWPYYRHDLQLTGRSPGKGNMDRAPREKWKFYIGGWSGLMTLKQRAGSSGEVRLKEGASFGADYLARTAGRWDAPPLVDLTGDGKLVPAPPGKLVLCQFWNLG
jgi:hypothetical protein